MLGDTVVFLLLLRHADGPVADRRHDGERRRQVHRHVDRATSGSLHTIGEGSRLDRIAAAAAARSHHAVTTMLEELALQWWMGFFLHDFVLVSTVS